MDKQNELQKTDDGYEFGAARLDRSVDPFLASVRTPAGYYYDGGLHSTLGRALSWCRNTIAKDRRRPLRPAA